MTKIVQGIVNRVYESISEEDYEAIQKYYNDSMEMLSEVENIELPIPRLTKRVRALLELHRLSQEKEGNGSDKPDQIQESG